MAAFLDRYGPWAYCLEGHLHPPYEARIVDGPPPRKVSTAHLGPPPDRRAPELALTDDRGVPWARINPATGRLGRYRRPIGAQWLTDLHTTAARVNALRAIVANVSRGTVADQTLWDRLLEPQRLRPSAATLLDQKVITQALIGRWLVAEHIELDEAGNGYASGPAGALALALQDESETAALVGICARCDVTWRPGRRRDGGGIPPLCPRCAEYERLDHWRRTPRARTRGTRT